MPGLIMALIGGGVVLGGGTALVHQVNAFVEKTGPVLYVGVGLIAVKMLSEL